MQVVADSWLFYVEQDKQPKVMEALKNLLYVSFEFENDGTQVIYFKAEDYDIPQRFLIDAKGGV